jgi:asparagine synthase (glutamine-hydrolysing)
MCGIIGIFSLDGAPVADAEPALRAGMRRMTLRGPDDSGLFVSPHALLGHRRLSIIDLASGRQPMTDPSTGATLVFNGEIYNYRELRPRLEARGRVFRTVSDSEVLLNAFLEWGEDCLAQLSGMFAFAVYLPAERRLFLARDRVGIKPLFMAQAGGRLMFASTIPALRCLPGLSPVMDLAAVSHYLSTIRTTFGNRTLFRDIRTLLPGECLTAHVGGREPVIRRYWDFPILKPAEKPDPGLDQAAARVRDLLTGSVREQLISDVPLGGFLSGGLDSSILAGLAHTLAPGRYDAYATGYDIEGFHEWPYVRLATAFHRMACQEVHLGFEGFTDTWRYLVAHHGLPLSTWNQVPIYHLASALRRDFTVALSGEGADEIFGGYVKSYFSAHDFDRARREPPAPGEPLTALDRALMRVYRRPYLMCVPDHFFLLHSWIPLRQKRKLLTDPVWIGLEQDAALFQFYEDWFDRFRDCSTMDAYLHLHARINLEGLLFRVDACTMAVSVEARVPFTDHRLVEYVFTLPDSYKIRWKSPEAEAQGRNLAVDDIETKGLLESKVLLRRAFADLVPRDILERPKMSFPVPVCDWFAGPLLEPVRDLIRASTLPDALFAPDMIEYYLKTPAYRESAMALWPIANLCLWQVQSGARLP